MALTIKPEITSAPAWNGHRNTKTYTATVGGVSMRAPKAAAAVAALGEVLAVIDSPVFRSTSDGAVWVAYWDHAWQYRICRPGPGGRVRGGTCIVGATQGECVRAMEDHIAQYETDL